MRVLGRPGLRKCGGLGKGELGESGQKIKYSNMFEKRRGAGWEARAVREAFLKKGGREERRTLKTKDKQIVDFAA